MPAERRNQRAVQRQLLTLEECGLAVVEDPGESITTAEGSKAYIENVVEHIKHGILLKSGYIHSQNFTITSPPPSPSIPAVQPAMQPVPESFSALASRSTSSVSCSGRGRTVNASTM